MAIYKGQSKYYVPNVTSQAQTIGFVPMSFAGDELATTTANYPVLTDFGQGVYRRSWQLTGSTAGVSQLVMNGGIYPNDIMTQSILSASPLVSGRQYIRSVMGIPYAVGNNVYWGTPGVFDTTNPSGTGTLVNSNTEGPFRLHHSMNYEYNLSGNRSTLHRDVLVPAQGRLGGVRINDGTRLDVLGVDPFLQPASQNVTLLNGDPSPNMRYIHFAIRPLQDADTADYFWPGQDTGNYNSGSTDGPHYAMNIWQKKGKFSGVVTLNMKWQGERFFMVQQDPTGAAVATGPMIGVNGPVTNPVSDFANMWLNFCVRVVPGRAADGDSPQCDIWFKNPLAGGTWVNVWSQTVDILSEIEDFRDPYGVPLLYIGTSNSGFYPSTRLSGFSLTDRFAPFLDVAGTTKYFKIDHAEQRFFDTTLLTDPGPTAVLAAIDNYIA